MSFGRGISRETAARPCRVADMPLRQHQVKNLRLTALFLGEDSPGVGFDPASAKLASIFGVK
jgi:hypothetical protein